MRVPPWIAVWGLAVVWTGVASGQEGRGIACRGQRVSAIRIESRAPSVADVRRIPVVSEVAQTVHVTTRPNVVERALLMRVGDACTERRRLESERILRAQPFIADATVTALPDGQGGVELDVQTIDEVAAVFSTTLKPRAPVVTGLRLGDANWGGEGVYAAGSWWHDRALRDGVSFRATDYQFLGRPYQATVIASRNPLGGELHADVQRPFFTDLQRVAWRMQQGQAVDYVRFADRDGGIHANRLTRDYADIGGVGRIGPPGRLALVGFSLSHEAERPGTVPILLTDTGVRPDPQSALALRFVPRSVSRVNALLGFRNLKYVRAVAVDGLRDIEDIPAGIQVGALVGKSAGWLGSSARDVLVGTDLYAAAVTSRSALRLQVSGEAHHDQGADRWEGVLGSGRLAWNQRAGGAQTLVSAVEWSGGWNVRVPFRVSLAGSDGGVRGMAQDIEQGGQRLVVRLEDRWTSRERLNGAADVGLAVFADAGRLWAGGVPYGSTTPFRYSAGVSLLAAVPSRSSRMWRLDLAVPNVPGRGVRLAIRLSETEGANVFWREPRDVARARERSVPASLFNWP